jgi:uncharacterized C2H2 Zn-finger protein
VLYALNHHAEQVHGRRRFGSQFRQDGLIQCADCDELFLSKASCSRHANVVHAKNK